MLKRVNNQKVSADFYISDQEENDWDPTSNHVQKNPESKLKIF